jgi:hypothetical protein
MIYPTPDPLTEWNMQQPVLLTWKQDMLEKGKTVLIDVYHRDIPDYMITENAIQTWQYSAYTRAKMFTLVATVALQPQVGDTPNSQLERAFASTNHGTQNWTEQPDVVCYEPATKVRSTSVGDVLVIRGKNIASMVDKRGYQTIKMHFTDLSRRNR